MELVKGKSYLKEEESIYKTIKKCTEGRKVNINKCDELLVFLEKDDCIKENRCNLKSEEQKQIEKVQVDEIMNIIDLISTRRISFKDVEERLELINFSTLDIIDQILNRIDLCIYNQGVYQTFKSIFYTTTNKEIMKLSIELTAIMECCSELFEDYLLVGQCKEFTMFVSAVLCKWSDNKRSVNTMLKLLEYIESKEGVYYAELLLNIDEIMEDINNQRRLLIALTRNKDFLDEVAIYAIDKLDVSKLSKIAHNDLELSKAIVEIVYGLCDNSNKYGDLLCVEDPIKIINEYLRCIKYSKYEEIKEKGILNIYNYLNKDSIRNRFIKLYNKKIYNDIFDEIKFVL